MLNVILWASWVRAQCCINNLWYGIKLRPNSLRNSYSTTKLHGLVNGCIFFIKSTLTHDLWPRHATDTWLKIKKFLCVMDIRVLLTCLRHFQLRWLPFPQVIVNRHTKYSWPLDCHHKLHQDHAPFHCLMHWVAEVVKNDWSPMV